jgi:hypothetical protein
MVAGLVIEMGDYFFCFVTVKEPGKFKPRFTVVLTGKH